MKIMPYLLGITTLLILLSTGCSPKYTPFTRNIYENHNWTDADLKKVQFYLSDDLIIYRNLDETDGIQINSGEITLENGKKIQKIRFKKGTPGVFISRPKDDHFAISFENKGDEHYLMFGPNPKRNNHYTLLASEWNRRSGKVTYSGAKFQTISDEIPELLVNMQYKRYRTVESHTADGRRVE